MSEPREVKLETIRVATFCEPGETRASKVNAYTRWYNENYPGHKFVRSSCIGCPYHTNAEWETIRENPSEWDDACYVDEQIRNPGTKGKVFLHRSRVALREAVLKGIEAQDEGPRQECFGFCDV